jgi:hypothetical protein
MKPHRYNIIPGMQNRYVGDVGDFGKYGLLRALLGAGKRLGIVWYLVPDEDQTNDGWHIDYLNKPEFEACDPPLFAALNKIVNWGRRHTRAVEQSGIFPPETVYYSQPLSFDGRTNRQQQREDWLRRAMQAVAGCDIIFCDPDNGLQVPSVNKQNPKVAKYIFYDEARQFLSAADTLVIYHHLSRQGTHLAQVQQRAAVLKKIVGPARQILTLRFRAYSPRAYFILTNQQAIIERIKTFAQSSWKQHFQLF